MEKAIRTVSSKYIIQRTFANHSINNGNWENDALDWVGQAINFIGKHVGFKISVCCDVRISNYMTAYPINMEALIAVVHRGELLPLGGDLSKGQIRNINSGSSNQIGRIANSEDITELNLLLASQAELIAEYAVTPTSELA